ncbi:MAG: PEGA domain-containing protein [Candidatus Wallbacteria bacterium]|nr:PEGA domain-containing protein [Candidatus Wallbacteria bacterium]
MLLPIFALLLTATSALAQQTQATAPSVRTTADAVREALGRIGQPAAPSKALTAPATSTAAAPAAPPATNTPPAPSNPLTSAPASAPATAPAPIPPPAGNPSTPPTTPVTESLAPVTLSTDGALRVETDPPGADVSLDRQLAGSTPLFMRGLAPGVHELEVSRSGATIRRRQIRIAAGKVLNLRLPGVHPALPSPITTDQGFLTVEVKPAGTSVYLPGRELLGKTPIRRAPLEPGFFMLTLESPGHGTEEREVRVDRGHETRIVSSLSPKKDLISVFRTRRRDRERDLYLAEAKRLARRGEFGLALERTRQALALDPASADAYALLAQLYNSLGDKAGYAEATAKLEALRER